MSEQSAPHVECVEASEAIETLRKVAATLKGLGEELADERQQHAITLAELGRVTEALAEAEFMALSGAEALTAVDDYRLGLCDKAELLQRVCGRT